MNYDEIINKLDSFLLLTENWDSYGSPQISEAVINKAIEFVIAHPGNDWTVVPTSNGGVGFEQHLDGLDIEVFIGPSIDIPR